MNDPCGHWIAHLNEARSEIERLSSEGAVMRTAIEHTIGYLDEQKMWECPGLIEMLKATISEEHK